ncbi:MAG TPA: hypothetical protein VKY90_10360 [Candidatus Dormibacteraeota bacterium]|nr:hypothetical protein [Candidatus Dormibacteraeota bacterium]
MASTVKATDPRMAAETKVARMGAFPALVGTAEERCTTLQRRREELGISEWSGRKWWRRWPQ